jgi:hypothetical protein
MDIPGRPWGQGDQIQHDLPSPSKEYKALSSSLFGGERNSEKVSCKDCCGLMLPQSGAHSSTHVAWWLWLWPTELEAFCAGDTDPKKNTLLPIWILEASGEWPWGSQVERYQSFQTFNSFLLWRANLTTHVAQSTALCCVQSWFWVSFAVREISKWACTYSILYVGLQKS